MTRDRRLLAACLAALMVCSVATVGVAASWQSSQQTDRTTEQQVAQSAAANESTNATEGWPAQNGGPGNAHATTDDGPMPYGNASWFLDSVVNVQTVIDGDRLFVVSSATQNPHTGLIEGYDSTAGQLEWSRTDLGTPGHSIVATEDRLFVHVRSVPDYVVENQTHGLHALDASTGATEWNRSDASSAEFIANGRLYTSIDGNLAALDPATGATLWTSDVESQPSMALAGGTLFLSGNDDAISAVDASDGSLEWERSTVENVSLTGLAATEDRLFMTNLSEDHPSMYADLPSTNRTVYAFDADDGSRRWTTNVSSSLPNSAPYFLSEPAVANGSVFVVTNAATVQDAGQNVATVLSLDAATGDREWRFQTNTSLSSDPAVANGTVYAAGSEVRDTATAAGDFAAFALDAEDGSETWNVSIDREISDAVAEETMVADGYLYIEVSGGPGMQGSAGIQAVEPTDERPSERFLVTNDDPVVREYGPSVEITTDPEESPGGYHPIDSNVTLTATADPGSAESIVSHEWDVDDDGEYEETGNTTTVRTNSLRCLDQPVTVRVTNDDGDTETETILLRTGPQ